MTTYYVSSEIGNGNNAGTSASAPLASLQAAADVVKPGDTVEVMNGTYTAPFYGDALDITTSGTASAPITFEAAPGQTPVINSSGGWNAINIQASYIIVSGFTVVGDASNYTLQSALAGYSTGSSSLDGNGIAINPSSTVPLPNHITIENNTVYDEPGGGIYTEGADYVQILNNVVYNNANWSAFGNSGVSVSTSENLDTNSGPHIIISGNLVYDNAQLVPTNGASGITDGEGIILDTNPNYTSEILVENNTVYGNGSSGIESFLTNGAVITGNTVYGNNTQNVQAASVAQIFVNQSNNDSVTNNNTSNPNVAVPVISQGVVNSNDSVTLTGTAVAGSTVAVSDGGSSLLGTTVASNAGSWSLTTLIQPAGSYDFTATDTTSIGTSAPSTALSLTVPTSASNTQTPSAPVISSIAVNSNDSITLTGTATADSTVTVWSTTGTDDGTATVSSSGAWNFTTPTLLPSVYGYTATDTTPGGTSAQSNALGVTVPSVVIAAPVISNGAVNANDSVTLTGTAAAGSTVTVSDGGASALGTATANSAGGWTFTSADLSSGSYAFTATDTTSAGTSAKSTALNVTVPLPSAPVISNGAVNANNSVTLTGTAAAGSTVTVSDGGASALGTATANSAGGWTFTSADLSSGSYAFTATDTTSAGTSAKSTALNVTVPLPSAPVISNGAVNANDSVTLTGTAAAGSTVTVSDGGASALGTATANSAGGWTFTSADLSSGSYAFTATDTTSAGTSAKSTALNVTVPLPSAPVISNGAVNANDSVTLTGTAAAGSTVTVSDGGASALGTATANSAGGWTFTSADLSSGSYAFTATDTTSAGTSAKSTALNVTVPLPSAPVISNGAVNANELGDADRDGRSRLHGDGVGWRRERAWNRDRQQRRRLDLHQRRPVVRLLRVHRHRYDVGGDERKIDRAQCDRAAAVRAGDQQRRGQRQRLGDADRDGRSRLHGDGVGWRRERAWNRDRQQRRRLDLHQRRPVVRLLRVHRHRYDVGGDERKIDRAQCDRAAAVRAGDQQRRGQCQRLGDADRDGRSRLHGDGVGWRRERAWNCDRQQRRRLDLHQRRPVVRLLRVHRHRYDVGGDERKIDRAQCDRAAAVRAGDQQRRGQRQRLGDADRDGRSRLHGDGVGWRRERAWNRDRQQRRRLDLHQRRPVVRLLRVHRHRYDVGGDERKIDRAQCDRAAAVRAGDQQRRGQRQRLGDADRDGRSRLHGDGVGWRRERAWNRDRQQRRRLDLHQRRPVVRLLRVHRHRYDVGGDERKIDRAQCDRAAAVRAGDQQRRGQRQRLGDADRDGRSRLHGDGVGRRRERAWNRDRQQRRRLDLHQRRPVVRLLRVHRHRYDIGGEERKIDRARCDRAERSCSCAGHQ